MNEKEASVIREQVIARWITVSAERREMVFDALCAHVVAAGAARDLASRRGLGAFARRCEGDLAVLELAVRVLAVTSVGPRAPTPDEMAKTFFKKKGKKKGGTNTRPRRGK